MLLVTLANVVLLLGGGCAAMMGLAGCDMANTAEGTKRDVEREWHGIENSPKVQRIAGHAKDALHDLEEASKAGAAAVEKKAEEAMKVAIQKQYAVWQSAMKPLGHPYVIPPKCLLALAVGGGAVEAVSALGLAALGFAAEGVEAGSLAALWQTAFGDVEAGSLFARLQSLGAKGLSITQGFEVTGVIATIAACFCGVVNDLCHDCISSTRFSGQSNASIAGIEMDESSQMTLSSKVNHVILELHF